jgi:hypothetical protein
MEKRVMASKHKEFDAIIVGSGPGGSTVANKVKRRATHEGMYIIQRT